MKISRLYIRNFITVMSMIFASHILIIVLFHFAIERIEHGNLRDDISGLAFMVKDTVESYIGTESRIDAPRVKVESFLQQISRAWTARIWVLDSSGKILAASVLQSVPDLPPDFIKAEDFDVYFHHEPPHLYLKIPAKIANGNGMIVIIIDRPARDRGDFVFFLGLLIITIIVLIVLLPLSRMITNPLKNLTDSADAISRGEFDRRVDESSSDETGELAHAFNRMSDRVLLMIRGTKELTANISHRIRSPLARMTVATEMLRDTIKVYDSIGSERALETIEREISEMNTLTGKIIELIRADVAHKSGEYENIDLSKVVSDAAVSFGDMMKKKSITYAAFVPVGLCAISGLPHDMEELLEILFDNAVKYSPSHGTIRLEIRKTADQILLSIENGAGIFSADDLENLFEPFTRKSSERIPGYGLGLAIAKRIVENHGGKIWAENAEGGFRVNAAFHSVVL